MIAGRRLTGALKAVGSLSATLAPRKLSVPEGRMPTMGEWVSFGAVGKRLGVSGGDNRRAGYAKVTAGRPDAWVLEPPTWLCKAQAPTRRSARKAAGRAEARRIGVSTCVCGTVRRVRPSLVEGYTYLVCGPWSRSGKRQEVPIRPGTILVHTFNVAGFFDGSTYRIATAEERASSDGAAALAWAAFLNAPGEPGSDG
jgi:hypothetical protein